MTSTRALLLIGVLGIAGGAAQPSRCRSDCLRAFPLFAIASYVFEECAHALGRHAEATLIGGVGVTALAAAMANWPYVSPALGVVLTTVVGAVAAERRYGSAILIASISSGALWLTRQVGNWNRPR
jgi:hypothetical protein